MHSAANGSKTDITAVTIFTASIARVQPQKGLWGLRIFNSGDQWDSIGMVYKTLLRWRQRTLFLQHLWQQNAKFIQFP